MKKAVEKELLKLATGELASILVFWLCYLLWFRRPVAPVMYSLSVLCFVLLQGSVYWFICLRRLTRKTAASKVTGKCYRALKFLDVLLIAGFVPVLIVSRPADFSTYFWGIFLILFAIVELVNYYLVRLSYPRIGILLSQIQTGRLRKSKIAEEIRFRGE